MEAVEVLRALECNTGVFPSKAVEAATGMREEITPELLRILEDTVERADEIVREDENGAYFAHLFAMYLLAQFRETRAYPLVVRFARLEEGLLDALAGDFVTEDLCRVLASVCDGGTGPIEQLIEDENVAEYARSAALHSLLVLVAEGDMSRDEAMAYFRDLFEGRLERAHSQAWDSLVDCATHLHPEEVSEHITAAFEEGLVDEFFISPRDVERVLKKDRVSVFEDLRKGRNAYITDVADDMAWYACFEQQKRPKGKPKPPMRTGTPLMAGDAPCEPNRAVKTGRNEPCPCGSGRKFKKCCGRTDRTVPQPERFIDPRIHEIRLSLQRIEPEVWRLFQVPGDISLARLHHVLQSVMGWAGGDYHAHVFWTPKGKYGVPAALYTDMIDESKVTLSEMVHNDGREFMYVYDFGDQWRHILTVENVFEPEPGVSYPVCVAGARACPPEDSGGVSGYHRLLDMLNRPDAYTEEYVEWLGGYDPERFDLEAINRRI